jgi:flagellar basal body-associated protein FliL
MAAGSGVRVDTEYQPKGRSSHMLTILLIVLVLILLLGGFGFSRRGRRGM